ncbi:hypothetical protein ACN6LL_007974, partial [Streptomyces violaceoruber]
QKFTDGHSAPVRALCAVPAGDGFALLASASDNGTVRLWDPAPGTQKHADGHSAPVRALCAVPAGDGFALLASASDDGTVRLWDPATGTQEHSLRGHSAPVRALCSIQTGDDIALLASASDDRTVRLWNPDGSPLSEIPVSGLPNSLIAMDGMLAIALDIGVLTVDVGRV